MKKIIIAGGDLRQIYAAEKLSERYEIIVIGFENYTECVNNINPDEIDDNSADAVLLPVPVSSDNIFVNAPFSAERISLKSVLSKLKKSGTVYGGKISSEIRDMLSREGISFSDYMEREELSVLNAVSTAEGALQIFLENSERTVYGQKILITGFGRIAKVLVKILSAMGADVTVAARKKSDRVWAEIYGCKSCSTDDIIRICGSYDGIFNTVPAMIFTKNILEKLKKDVIFTDLASKPGGADYKSAENLGLNMIHALALPGKTAPESAGCAVAYSVMNIADEEGGN